MALTTTTIKWDGANADVIIDGTTYPNVASPYTVELQQGDHTCKIVQGNKTIYNGTLHVPKALADKVEEEIQSRGMVTQDQLQAQVENVLETSQGYIDIIEVKDESVYNTGEHNNQTLTQWKLYYKVVQPQGGSVPSKIKTIDTDDQVTTVDIDLNATNSVLVSYNPPAGGLPQATVKEIQVLAGNNKIIDKLDLSMIVTETDAPCPECPPCPLEKINIANITDGNTSYVVDGSILPVNPYHSDFINLTSGKWQIDFMATQPDNDKNAKISVEILDSDDNQIDTSWFLWVTRGTYVAYEANDIKTLTSATINIPEGSEGNYKIKVWIINDTSKSSSLTATKVG